MATTVTQQPSATTLDAWGNPVTEEQTQTMGVPNLTPPAIPGYVPTWNNSFSVGNYMQPKLDKITGEASMTGLTNFENEANQQGPSAWAGLAQKANRENGLTQLDANARNSAGQTAQAQSNLALHGGLDSGARERIAQGGANQEAAGAQAIGNQTMQNSSNIGIQDAQQRIQEQEMLPQIQNEYLQPQFQAAQLGEQAFATDVQGQEKNVENQNSYNMNKFGIQGQMYGAQQQANATAGAGGSSCWIISGLARHQKLPKDEPELLTQMKYYFARLHPKLALFYFKRCGELIPRMDRAGFDWDEMGRKNEALVLLLRAGEMDAASRLFAATVLDFIDRFWSDCPSKAYLRARRERTARILVAQSLSAPSGDQKFSVPCLENLPPECFQA